MEEYYILLNLDNKKNRAIHLYHKNFYIEEEIKTIIKHIYDDCKNEAPKVLEENMFTYYLEYKLKNDFGFEYSQKRNYYTFDQDEIFN